MDYQVSARKWRPQKFSELVGQEHIVQTLKNAIELNRVSHAYLFSGTRGVGKTTTARILAKVLNCQDTSQFEPCDKCDFCIEIRQGSNIDVQEIDGASNNGVGEIRELIDNVQYATSACRYKVYIIDEVHMLSKSAFNALLKTLEEPPPSVVFIFATTELTKIPETILSRCQCFEFKPLSHKQIVQQLQLICSQEKIEIDDVSLEEIARNGMGSMRDAQSLLDQVIAYCGREVVHGSVESVLGIVGGKTLTQFVEQLIAKDASAMLELIHHVAESGKELQLFCRDLIGFIRNLMVVKVSAQAEKLLDAQVFDLPSLKALSEKFVSDELQQIFTVLSRADNEMKRSSHPKLIFEMAVLRLSDVRPFKNIDETIAKINELQATLPPSAPQKTGEQVRLSTAPTVAPVKTSVSPQDVGPASGTIPQATDNPERKTEIAGSTSPGMDDSELWQVLQKAIIKKKGVFSHYLNSCRFLGLDEKVLHLEVAHVYTRSLIETDEKLEIICEAVKAVTGQEVRVNLTLPSSNILPTDDAAKFPDEKKNLLVQNKTGTMNESEIIQEAIDIFGGTVVR
jgi:DNA polymerase-3 subunit gamma/tau